MAIDPDRILTKIAYIREQVEAVERLVRTRTEDEILGDPWLLRGLKYALQTAIEAMIDIAFHVAAKEFSRAPADGREALNILVEGGIIRQENLPTYLSSETSSGRSGRAEEYSSAQGRVGTTCAQATWISSL